MFDADDADILDEACRETVIECCRDSVAVIAGSHFLANVFRQYNQHTDVVWTGTYFGPLRRGTPNRLRLPVVAWATTNPMGYRSEAELVREIVMRLARRTEFSFYQYGVSPDQRDAVDRFLAPIRACGVPVAVFAPMPYKRFVKSLNDVAVGLQPVCVESPFSRGKSFGKILAYLAADVAVVASCAVDHPLFFRDRVNGILVPNDVERWVDGTSLLLQDPSARAAIVAQARADFLARLTTPVAAALVSEALVKASSRVHKEVYLERNERSV